ncbi:exopolysaccharide biosynthesis polyprenyl glycosylphosphotransferase [Streptomyces sp. NPDC057702]|uniref:exopolysaccharide biosynthesis polyprenyl glycosylphosphotransferase n=1 Tax=unclassified Streptomyces TaxID=2593676 RepID=UPI003683DF96
MTTENVGLSESGGALGRLTPDRQPRAAVYAPRNGQVEPPPPRRRTLTRHDLAPLVLLAADCAATTGALFLADAGQALRVLVPALAVLLALNAHAGLYRPGLSTAALDELPTLLWHSVLTWCVVTTGLVVLEHPGATRWAHLLTLLVVHAPLMCVARAAAHLVRRRVRRRAPSATLVIGSGPVGERVLATLLAAPAYGLRPVGLVRVGSETPPAPALPEGTLPEPGAGRRAGVESAPGTEPSPGRALGEPGPAPVLAVPVLAGYEDIGRAIAQHDVRAAVLTRTPWEDPHVATLLGLLRAGRCTVWLVTAAPGPALTPPRDAVPDHLWGFTCQRLAAPPRRRIASVGKRALDVGAATLGLVAVAPLLAACALAVRCSDGPGVLFRQERVGRDGRPFVVLKFRTLRSDAYESATRWSVADDRRMSAVGRWLRRTSLDELPQLWNVLRGDMSLVGPRPERPYFVREFSQRYPTYRARHRMPVGITGLAQVHGLRGDTSIEDRVRFDNHYIETWSLWQDVRILLRTAGALFRCGGS